VASRVTEFKILTFGPMGGIANLKGDQLETRGVEGRLELWKEMESGGVGYSVGWQKQTLTV